MGKQQPSLDELFPKKTSAATSGAGLDIESLFPKKKDDTALSGATDSWGSIIDPLSEKKFSLDAPSEMGRSAQSFAELDKEQGASSREMMKRALSAPSSSMGLSAGMGGFGSAGLQSLEPLESKTKKISEEEKEYARIDKAKKDYLDDITKSEAFFPTYSMANSSLGGGMFKLLSNAPTALGAITEFASNVVDAIVNPKIPVTSSGFGIEGVRQKDFDLEAARKEYSKPREKSSESVAGTLYELGNNLSQVGESYLRNSARSLGVKEQNVGRGFTELISEGEKRDAFVNLGIQAISQLPQVLAMSATGGSAGAVFASSALLGTTSALQEEYAMDGDITAANAIKSLGKGIVEGVTETVFRTDIQAARQLGKGIFDLSGDAVQQSIKSLIKEEGKEAAKDVIVRNYGQVFRKALGGASEEGVEEVLSSAGSFIIDRIEDGKWSEIDYQKLLSQAADSFFIGAATGGILSGGVARASLTPLNDEQKNRISKLKEITLNASLSKEVRNIASSQIDDIIKFSSDKTNALYNDIASLPRDKRAQALELTNKIKNLEEDKSEVKDIQTQEAIDSSIQSLTSERQSIFDSYKEEVSTSASNLEALVQGEKFEAQSDKPYVFTFKEGEELPESLKGVEPSSILRVSYGGSYNRSGVPSVRYTFSGKDLIEAGVAKEATPAQADTENTKAQEIEQRRQEELAPYVSQITTSEETFEGLDLEGNPVVYVVRTKADGSREVRLQITIDGKITNMPIGKAGKDITFSNAELIEKSYANEPKSISINNNPSNPTKINKINEKYNKELAALGGVAAKEIKQQENEGQPIAQEPITAEETTVINNAISNVVRVQAEKQAKAKPAGLKGRAYEKVLDLEDNTPEALAIKFFASGGKVLKENPKDYIGAKRKTLAGLFTTSRQGGNIVSKEELKSRSSISGNEASGALSIDAIAEKLWEQSGARQEDKGDYLSAVESVLTGFSNKTQMANYLLEKNKVEKTTGIQLGEDFENQRMQYEADRLGMTMEEFQDYIDNNVDYQEARDEAMDETQDILNNIQDYPELLDSMGLSQEEIDDINNLFAEEVVPQEDGAQEEEEAAPAEPTVPPTPPTETPVEEKPTGEELPDEVKEAREVYENKMSELAKESLVKKKSLLSRLPEMLYDSKFKARRAINALDKYSLAGARLQTLLGINKKIAERLSKIDAKIYDDTNINDEKIMDVAIFNKHVIELDERRENKRAKEQERLTENFIKKNDREPNEGELKSIISASKAKFPKLSHGTRMFEGKIVPMTGEIAKQSLAKMEQQLGEKAFNRIMGKLELYRDANNKLLKELYDNGSITKEVYEEYLGDFYAMRQTVDMFFDSFSEQDKNLHASAAKAWNAISKKGATNTLMLDSRALLAMSYSATIRNLQKNKFKQALYNETIGADANVNWAKPANIKTKKLGAEAGKVLLDKKGEQVLPADKGFKNISFMQEGKVKHFQVDEDIYDQLEGLNQVFRNAPIEDGVLINLNDYRNRLLTGFATRYNPTFFWRNAALDLTHQVIFTDIWGKSGNVFSSGLRAMYNTFRMMDVINSRKGERLDNLAEFIEAGGHMDLLSASSESKKQLYEQQRAAAQGKDYINVDSKKGKIGAALGFVNERLELGMRLAAYNQVKKTTTAEFIKRNDGKPLSDAQKLQVNEIAAAQARGYTDFAQKGTWLPYKVNIPYMNAAFQTFGKSVEYIADNPKSFVWKMAQIGSINFMWTLALMTLMGDDYWDISEYDRDNILVPVPYSRDVVKGEDGKEKGEWNLAKFGVHSTLIPFFRATRFAAEKVHGIITGKTRETDAMETFDGAIEGINKALPLPVIFATPKQAEASLRGVISKDLWMNAAMKAYTGYDIFRNRDIVTEQERKGEFKEEGMLNKQVPYIYKAVGNSIGFSPARLQAVGETFYTSPSTNLLIAGAYDLTSDMANFIKPAQSDKERGLYTMSDPDKLMQSLTKRFIVKTDPEYAAKQRDKKLNEKAEELAQEAYSQELNVKNKIKEVREKYKGEENAWELIKSEVLPFVEKNADLVDKQRTLSLMRSANKAGKAKESISDVIEQRAYSLRYSPTINSKAELLMEMTNGDKAKVDELLDAAQDAGLSGSEKFKVLKRYNELNKAQKND